MTDARLQQLRRKAATGATEARAALLRGRIRAGELTRERVELAAYCGDEAAFLVAGEPLFVDAPRWVLNRWLSGGVYVCRGSMGDRWGQDDGWCCTEGHEGRIPVPGLNRCGQEAQVRAAVAAARKVLPVWECGRFGQALADYHAPRRAIEAAEAWCVCPCEAHAYALDTHDGHGVMRGEHDPSQWWRGLLGQATGAALQEANEHQQECLRRCMDGVARLVPESDLRTAIQVALIPWALGEGDPCETRRTA